MSRNYEITVEVEDHDRTKVDEIIEAVASLGYDAEVYSSECDLAKQGDKFRFETEVISISATWTEEGTAAEIHRAVWDANGAFCTVHVLLLDLDQDTPRYTGDESDYK